MLMASFLVLTPDCVSQVKLLEGNVAQMVLEDSGVPTHSNADTQGLTDFLCVSPSSICLSSSTLLINLAYQFQEEAFSCAKVPFASSISGAILSLGRLYWVGVLLVFEGRKPFFVQPGKLFPNYFVNSCWWLPLDLYEGAPVPVAESPTFLLPDVPVCGVVNAQSISSTVHPMPKSWHEGLAHAFNASFRKFLKKFVPGVNNF
ncbi:hypothetical protein O181_006396 [Austropuccinia psidii MF-1]|uniref:Uncharacterized protein n=1 Tax=Austropuccinia psidii MF-1 TaxID=1389203 RepID=A0A9Q3BJ33_9BASI|nr:hypothetical protein [Austropuccinia psidii MF-1]